MCSSQEYGWDVNKWACGRVQSMVAARGSALDDGEDVVLAHQEDLLVAVDLELVAGIGGEQDVVARLDLQGAALAVLGDAALADGEHLALLGLVLGGVGS